MLQSTPPTITAPTAPRKYRPGWILAETITALAVMLVLMGAIGYAAASFRRFNHYQLTRQRCLAAAEAQLDSVSTTGHAIPKETMAQLWPGVTVTVEYQPGNGDWQGLKLVTARAAASSRSREVTLHLARYVSAPAK